jgi:predicted O-linked N-acetylglucosamine transferase (SPINDLY family)
VLIPGIGQVSVFPNYVKRHPDKSKERKIINCAWTSPKLNYTMLKCLREIIDAVPGSMIRIFPAWTIGRHNSMVSCIADLSEMFGDEELAVCPEMPYQDYLTEMEKGSLTLDSWPFGGYNTIVDSLFVGVPVVTLEGTRFYNRASSALMRRVGLKDLVAKTKHQYVEKAIQYLGSSWDNKEAHETIADENRLRTLLCENGESDYFVKAFDYIIAHHARLKTETNREPIIIC